MNKFVKKTFALLLAMSVIFAMSLSAFADIVIADPNKPSANDKDLISVQNVVSGSTVTAYQIVKPIYKEGVGIEKYEPVISGTVSLSADPVVLSTEQVAVLAGKALDGDLGSGVPMSYNGTSKNYEATVGAGLYIVIIKGADGSKRLYNPVLVAVNYGVNADGKNIVKPGIVNVLSNYESTGYAKASDPKVDKYILDGTSKKNGDDFAYGDTVSFGIDTQIPSYNPDTVKDVTFKITDTMDDGLDLTKSTVKVKVGSSATSLTELDATSGTTKTYTLATSDHGFVVTFDKEYILANGLKYVTVTYDAVVNSNATYNYDPNKNTGRIDYTRTPDGTTGFEEDKTYQYTFGIDASLGGTKSGYTTHELVKTKAPNGAASYNKTTDEWSVTDPLGGAVFKLTNTSSGKSYEATSGGDGLLSFIGLDAGSYTLVETKAPAGYAVDTKTHSVVITPTYNTDGTLASYTVLVDGENTSTYTCDYTKTPPEVKVAAATATVIKNSPIPTLPSTGSMGTYLFTLVGVLIMTVGAVMFVRRRKSVAK